MKQQRDFQLVKYFQYHDRQSNIYYYFEELFLICLFQRIIITTVILSSCSLFVFALVLFLSITFQISLQIDLISMLDISVCSDYIFLFNTIRHFILNIQIVTFRLLYIFYVNLSICINNKIITLIKVLKMLKINQYNYKI